VAFLRPGRVRFRDAYDDAKLDYFRDIGASPRLTKDAIIGAIFKTGLKLIESEDATGRYRGCDALLKARKIRGWFGEGEDQSVLGTLSAAELKEIKEELANPNSKPSATASGELVN